MRLKGTEKHMLKLERMPYDLTVCKVKDVSQIDLQSRFFFIAKTDEELSLVCETQDVPDGTAAREDGWKAFRVQGVLDFSLTGILSRLSGILADGGIGIFAVSTYNTDYILVKSENFPSAMAALQAAGYEAEGINAQ